MSNVFSTYEDVPDMRPCRKNQIAHAVQMNEPFEVDSLEGPMKGKAGDYLMKGVKGELYICDAEIFKESYKFIG